MGILDNLAKIVRYPQSAATGLFNRQNAGKLYDEDGRYLGEYDPLKEGLKGNLTPGKLSALLDTNGVSTGDKISNTLADIVFDPINLLGGAGVWTKGAKALTKTGKTSKGLLTLQELAKGAGSFGKVEDATKTARLGQAARYLYQGTAAAEEGASGILGAAMLSAGLEKGSAKILSKLATKAGSDIIGQGAEEALSKTGLDELTDLLKTRPNSTIAKQLLELGPGPLQAPKFPTVLGLPSPSVARPHGAAPLKELEAAKQLLEQVPIAIGPNRPLAISATTSGPRIGTPGNTPRGAPVTIVKSGSRYSGVNPKTVKTVAKTVKPVAKKTAAKPKVIAVTKPKAKLSKQEAVALLEKLMKEG